MFYVLIEEEKFEDAKGVIRICKLKKDRQHNGQRKKNKLTNILQNTTKNSKIKCVGERHKTCVIPYVSGTKKMGVVCIVC
jgi:hypothetical protein